MSKRWLLGLLAGLLLYLGLGVWFGFQSLTASLGRLAWWWWLLAPATVALGHVLLFGRWQAYLAQLGHPLAWQRPKSKTWPRATVAGASSHHHQARRPRLAVRL